MTTPSTHAQRSKYLRTPVPVHFPEAELVPESKRHLDQRTALYQIRMLAFRESALIGSDQFVYWDPTDPRQCLAPDVFVRWGAPDQAFRSWKVWERGAPDVAVEILSASDERDRDWDEKLERYPRLVFASSFASTPRQNRQRFGSGMRSTEISWRGNSTSSRRRAGGFRAPK